MKILVLISCFFPEELVFTDSGVQGYTYPNYYLTRSSTHKFFLHDLKVSKRKFLDTLTLYRSFLASSLYSIYHIYLPEYHLEGRDLMVLFILSMRQYFSSFYDVTVHIRLNQELKSNILIPIYPCRRHITGRNIIKRVDGSKCF